MREATENWSLCSERNSPGFLAQESAPHTDRQSSTTETRIPPKAGLLYNNAFPVVRRERRTMDEQVSLLFREVADLPRAERENVFAVRNVSPELRAEVESLLACDSLSDHSVTECIGQAAVDAARVSAE